MFDINWDDEEIVNLPQINKRKRKAKPLEGLKIDDTIVIPDEQMFPFNDSDILRKHWSGIPKIRRVEYCFRFCNTMLSKYVSEELKYNLHEDIRNIKIPVVKVPQGRKKISNNRLETQIANFFANVNEKPIEYIETLLLVMNNLILSIFISE